MRGSRMCFFFRGGPNLIFLVDKGIEDLNTPYKWVIIGPIDMAFCWRSDDGPTLKAGLVAL